MAYDKRAPITAMVDSGVIVELLREVKAPTRRRMFLATSNTPNQYIAVPVFEGAIVSIEERLHPSCEPSNLQNVAPLKTLS